MISAGSQILTVLVWIIVIKFCQLALYPYLKPALKDIAYGLAYPVSIVLLTFVSWYLGMAHLPVQLSLLLFLALGACAVWKKQYSRDDLKKNLKWDMVFLAGFVLFLIIRFVTPGIIPSGEKIMDSAILASIMNNPVVTPADAWYAGESLSIYYYLGHWTFAVLGILSFGAAPVVFNLMIPTVVGLAAVSLFAIGRLILKNRHWLPILVLLIPTPALFVSFFKGLGILGSWWASTRVIGDGATINEYPLFSFLWGDPHAHVLGCFNQVLFICLLLVMLTQWKTLPAYGRYLLTILQALSLGCMPATNSWDVMIYAAVYIIVAVIVWWRDFNHKISLRAILPFAVTPVLSLLIVSPFLITMISAGGSSIQGFFFVTTPSDIVEFLGVWGFFLAVFILFGIKTLKKYPWLLIIPVVLFFFGYGALGLALFCILLLLAKKEFRPEVILAVIGLSVLIFMELFYLKDYMGDAYYRMNTVFKFGFACWFILGTSAMLIIGRAFSLLRVKLSTKESIAAGVIVLIILVPLLTFGGINMGYPSGTLDGSVWIESYYPGDAKAISYICENLPADAKIVEAAGTSYEYSSMVSAISGRDTILGWAGHETGWRSGIGNTSERMSDIREIYENPDECVSLMDKYGMKYIFSGSVEQKKYHVNLPADGLKEIFSTEGACIYQRTV
ncbi:MAG TPA: DUF2298 domain-containing protein [Methanocorpusculum sp.]|nr:DUF2298 domain-containing protein [Methanocorpusculum sp.]